MSLRSLLITNGRLLVGFGLAVLGFLLFVPRNPVPPLRDAIGGPTRFVAAPAAPRDTIVCTKADTLIDTVPQPVNGQRVGLRYIRCRAFLIHVGRAPQP